MDRVPAFFVHMSEHLSSILDVLGVDDGTVRKRRQVYLMTEDMWTDMSTKYDVTFHHFGSQTEGTTTLGLDSDLDSLACFNAVNVMRKCKQWEQGRVNLLIETDDNTISPGYCRLRCLRNDSKKFESADNMSDNAHVFEADHVYLENTYILSITERICQYQSYPFIKKGPSGSGTDKIDFVTAFRYKPSNTDYCKTNDAGNWPDADLSENAHASDRFIVPVGHPESDCALVEWRISASMTERRLMFSLNVTQIQCYVMMKMLKETFFKPSVGDGITSYHCKNTLFYTIARTRCVLWRPQTLFVCILLTLKTLLSFLHSGFCPQFVNPKVNLFTGKLSRTERMKMIDILTFLIETELRCILHIQIDELGRCLVSKCSRIIKMYSSMDNFDFWQPVQYCNKSEAKQLDGKAWRNWLALHFVFVTEFAKASGSYIAKYNIELYHEGFRVFPKEPEEHSRLEVVGKFTQFSWKIPLSVQRGLKQIMNTEVGT